MKLRWFETFRPNVVEAWHLRMASTTGALVSGPVLGNLFRYPQGWLVTEGANSVWLPNDLSLDDAQRAAKLLIAIGGRHDT